MTGPAAEPLVGAALRPVARLGRVANPTPLQERRAFRSPAVHRPCFLVDETRL